MTKTSFALALSLIATPALAIDPCLVGKWQADGADMAAVLAEQMNAQAPISAAKPSWKLMNSET